MWSGRCRCCCCCSNQKHCSQLTVKSGESHTLRTRFAVHSDPCQRCDGYPRRAAEPMSFRVPETALEQLAIGWSSSNNNNTMLLCATGPPSPLPYFFSTLTGLWKRKKSTWEMPESQREGSFERAFASIEQGKRGHGQRIIWCWSMPGCSLIGRLHTRWSQSGAHHPTSPQAA